MFVTVFLYLIYLCWSNDKFMFLFEIAEVFQRKDHDQDNLIKIEMGDVSVYINNFSRHFL